MHNIGTAALRQELSRRPACVHECFTTADLRAEIMREMEEVERIASVSSNRKGALVRRLRSASRRVRASSAELQQRMVATSVFATVALATRPANV